SEIEASTSWRMTRVIATAEEYDAALRLMQSPQIVRALVMSFLPAVDIRADGTAMLEATLYARAGEERVERRTLLLDVMNELHFHGRELIAEGRGGVRVGGALQTGSTGLGQLRFKSDLHHAARLEVGGLECPLQIVEIVPATRNRESVLWLYRRGAV